MWRVERVGVVESTNTLAMERVRELLARGEEIPSGLVIVAEGQRNGRGQHGRKWESPRGGLYLSAVVGEVPAQLRDRLALFVGVALAVGLEEIAGRRVMLRWPNDLMVEGKKIGGILCESVVMGERWAGIIGVGVNVRVRVEELPVEVRGRAGNLGGGVEVRRVEEAVLAGLAEMLERIQEESALADYVEKARRRDELLGKDIELETGEGVVSGIGAGVGDGGELLLQMEGRVKTFARGSVLRAGEISRPAGRG